MKWKMERKVEKAIEILETLNQDFGNFNLNLIKQKIPYYFSFVYNHYKYESVELWNNYDYLKIYLIYKNGKFFIRWYHTPRYFPAHIEDIEL
jgi:hypothetical protein